MLFFHSFLQSFWVLCVCRVRCPTIDHRSLFWMCKWPNSWLYISDDWWTKTWILTSELAYIVTAASILNCCEIFFSFLSTGDFGLHSFFTTFPFRFCSELCSRRYLCHDNFRTFSIHMNKAPSCDVVINSSTKIRALQPNGNDFLYPKFKFNCIFRNVHTNRGSNI